MTMISRGRAIARFLGTTAVVAIAAASGVAQAQTPMGRCPLPVTNSTPPKVPPSSLPPKGSTATTRKSSIFRMRMPSMMMPTSLGDKKSFPTLTLAGLLVASSISCALALGCGMASAESAMKQLQNAASGKNTSITFHNANRAGVGDAFARRGPGVPPVGPAGPVSTGGAAPKPASGAASKPASGAASKPAAGLQVRKQRND